MALWAEPGGLFAADAVAVTVEEELVAAGDADAAFDEVGAIGAGRAEAVVVAEVGGEGRRSGRRDGTRVRR